MEEKHLVNDTIIRWRRK